jgi:hypothetical protein
MGVPSKCGLERRESVHGLYGGYFYCRGKEAGKRRYKEVRQLVDKHLSPDTVVMLKRYCTEFEIGPGSLGRSDSVPDEITAEEREFEAYIDMLFPRVGHRTHQPEHVQVWVMRTWIHYAYQNGDPTYAKFTDGSPLFEKYVTYHDEENTKDGNIK